MARRVQSPGAGKGHGNRPKRDMICVDCTEVFQASRSDALRCGHCSQLRRNRTFENKNRRDSCPLCGELKTMKSDLCRSCEGKRRSEFRLVRGENNGNWKGGKTRHSSGYIQVRGTSERNSSPYQLEHIQVWEAARGPVPEGYQIHHINGIKDDNRLENLAAETASDHHSNKHHEILRKRILELEAQLKQ